ncbi:MAG: hypothetical protein HZB30_12275 [Nitrospirae bacterium]|nr:hypothetical protein [Nitrospirota bacterium]
MKNLMTLKTLLLLTLSTIFLVSLTGQAKAGTIIFPLDYEISGGTSPQGSAPWATATFVDAGSNTVQLTMSATNLTGTEFITRWFFNSSVDSTGLTFSPVNITAISEPTINKASNYYKADGDGYFDIDFDFQTSAGTGRFTGGETIVYNITGSSINATTFNLISAPDGAGNGLYNSVAKVQGINGSDGTSGWIANTTVVPEPVSSTLFIVGGLVLGFRRFRKMKKA